ncbi:bifunctional UDP-sugar hydrolase/5'-nucleotidase [Paenibacillus sp. GD4]|jgi:5'-nucleotidase|uniref:bifunctional metallophosphatase/5'-nucleotidase n=1 Tax=Paenibacillus sp. GD4 TaxID=3068890 RepID=UPI0027969139|nr:bifunctional UDP-sugar hydrolase/5'-nucleotidase [Paenibacillus sp. GD4]MDQ1910056.1 bifunctional UDP-sugar hydrolase/5'-nucleotidase [Paenibacillus sp. GD4]
MNADRIRLRILHTNDLHSRFEQMPKIAAVIRRLRSEAGEEHTVTLDIGDHLDRMFPETEGTEGLANIAVLNATGYDAVTLGNNEGLTFSRSMLAKLYAEAQFHIVASNLPETATGELPEWALPYQILTKSGIRIGLIGVTAYFTEYYRLLGWDIQEPLQVTEQLVRKLRPEVDVLIVMSHLGLRLDERMAQEIPGIDVILGGHTHHLLEEAQRMNQALVCATGKFGQYIGVVDLELDSVSKAILASAGFVIATEPLEETDSEVKQVIAAYSVLARQTLSHTVAFVDRALPIDWNGDSPLGNLLAAGLRRVTEAEIGLVNAGQLLGDLNYGPVTSGDLLALCPSPINPCRMTLTGAQLLRALEQALLPEYTEKAIMGFGFRGKVLGTLCLDGMTVEYDPAGEAGRKIHRVLVGSAPLELQRAYRIGTIDMFTFGIGYLPIAEGTHVEYLLPDFLRDVLLRELHAPGAIEDSLHRRWLSIEP